MTQAAAPAEMPSSKLRQREAALDRRASLIDTNTDLTFSETLEIAARGMFLVRHFLGRFLTKAALMFFAITVPVTIIPWPTKIIIDHVVLGRPIAEATGYPPIWRPFLTALAGASPLEVLLAVLAVFAVLILLIGGYAQGDNARDETEGNLEEGHDTATRVENSLHGAHSYLGGIYGYIDFKINTRLTQSVNHYLRARLFERIKALPMTTLEDQRIGDSVYRVMYDAPSINHGFYGIWWGIPMALAVMMMAIGTFMSAYPYSPGFILLTAAVFPLFFVLSVGFARMSRRRAQASRAAGAIATSTIEEGMDNVLAVQSLGGNRRERGRFADDSGESFKRYRGYVWVGITVGQLVEVGYYVIVMGSVLYASTQVIDGVLSPGDYGALLFYFKWIRGPARSMGLTWVHLQYHAAGLRRVFALTDTPGEEDLGSKTLPPIERGVVFRNAGLVYPDGRRALAGVNMSAEVGQIVAIAGPTGAGKTSLASLIPRYRVATEGEVLIDGVDVKDATLASVRSQVTYVFQETQLFSDTVGDNIRFGKPDASQAEVERVARVAGAHDFIAALPQGYDTKLGTSMSKLSVGQKQRIAIARGLLRDSRVLILDEPTSALDPETEKFLVRSLKEAARDRLVIVIAHRLSTIASADKIVFLEDGSLRETGSHAELMALPDGHYRRFVELQTGAA